MKKVLFVNFNCYWNPNFETELELMHQHQLDGNTVYSLHCQGELMQSCASASFSSTKKKFCKRCQKRYKLGCKVIKLPKENRFCLEILSSFPDYVTSTYTKEREISEIMYDGINIGRSILSNIRLIKRGNELDISSIKDQVDVALRNSFIAYSKFNELCQNYDFDSIYFFNGRHSEVEPLVSYCEKNNLHFLIHERGADMSRYLLFDNIRLYDIEAWTNLYKKLSQEYQEDNKENAINWFENKRNGIDPQWLVYTNEQKRAKLPPDFDTSKYNVTFFNSSLWEYFDYPDMLPQGDFANEIEVIEQVCKYFSSNPEFQFYFRVHPHLHIEFTDQTKEILEYKENNRLSNLLIIEPDEDIDTYELMQASNCNIISQHSTVGVESAYWGTPTILLGRATYKYLNICYTPHDINELFSLLQSKPSEVKNRENCYKYGYAITNFGEKFKYYKPKDLFEGKFLGVNLKNEIKLKNKIKKRLKL